MTDAPDDADGYVIPPRKMVPQPNGGAIFEPYPTTGPGKGVAAHGVSWRQLRKAAVQTIREGTPEAAARIVALSRSTDERIATVNSQFLMKLAMDVAVDDGDLHGVLDTRNLTPEQRARLRVLVEEMNELMALCRPAAMADGVQPMTIEGDVG